MADEPKIVVVRQGPCLIISDGDQTRHVPCDSEVTAQVLEAQREPKGSTVSARSFVLNLMFHWVKIYSVIVVGIRDGASESVPAVA